MTGSAPPPYTASRSSTSTSTAPAVRVAGCARVFQLRRLCFPRNWPPFAASFAAEPHECQNLSETSLNAVLAGCPLLQSLMLTESIGCKCIRIVSPTLRSIGVRVCWGDILLDQLIIEDAPSLERFILLGYLFHTEMFISVISAPKLKILGQLHYLQGPTLEFGNSVFKVHSV